MAGEAVLVVEYMPPINFVCDNQTGIEKGALLAISGATALRAVMIASEGAAGEFSPAGVAAAEKIANDGNTTIPVYRNGIFRVLCSGAITAGHPVVMAGVNAVKTAAGLASSSGAKTMGIMLETGADAGTALMELHIGASNLT